MNENTTVNAEAKSSPLTGTVIRDRYFVMEKIAEGGGGSLYLARDMELGTFWALKTIPSGKKQEARILTKLHHPGLPKVMDYAEKDGQGYLVMEYIRGSSLEDLRKQGKRFSPKETAGFAREILDILSCLHSQKPPILYGDLKPSNLMLSENGRLYLVDFGSAIRGYGEKETRCSEGTPGYAAPEQYEGRLTPRSDLYSLGKTLLALLRGKQPPLLWKLSLWYQAPGLALFLQTCCRQKEQKRYQSAGEAAAALSRKITRQKNLRLAGSALTGALLLLLAMLILLPKVETAVPSLFTDTEQEPEEAFWRDLTKATEPYSLLFRSGKTSGRFAIPVFTSRSVIPISTQVLVSGLSHFPQTHPPSGINAVFPASVSCHGRTAREVEISLRKMLWKYRSRSEQRILLLRLAANAQLDKNYGQAALYFEQLLLSDPECREAYLSYEEFLRAVGQEEGRKRLQSSSGFL